ncbi:MAG: hypothetical protein JWP56_1503, partial [Aeromicrobium sp.]|nr:hypothetical protein [Aeromicrobium sp.]
MVDKVAGRAHPDEMVTISTWRPVLCGALLAGGIVAATTPAASAAVCTSGVPGDV